MCKSYVNDLYCETDRESSSIEEEIEKSFAYLNELSTGRMSNYRKRKNLESVSGEKEEDTHANEE
jgi:hypothetical protein